MKNGENRPGMRWQSFPDHQALSQHAAGVLLSSIRAKPQIVLGLPTGRTPVAMYDRIVAECSREYHCFREVTTFNLDEYVGLPRNHPGSYYSYMRTHLFDHVDIDPARAHVPRGDSGDPEAECARYEEEIRRAGGLDLTFLGLGRNGHIAFNEPGTPFDSRTRVVELHISTKTANADLLGGEVVPESAITMGIATILESRRIVLLAGGESKREALERLRSGEVTTDFPASALHGHPDVTVLVS